MGDELKVCVESLRQEANLWDEQSQLLGQVKHAAEAQRLDAWDAGVFFALMGAHNDFVTLAAEEIGNGSAETARIAEALRTNANKYESREAETTATVHGAF